METTPFLFQLNDKESYPVKITFAKLATLRKKNKSAYEKYNKIIINGAQDVFDLLYIIYVGYLCGNEGEENQLSYEYFIENAAYDVNYVVEIVAELTQPKKK